ncbi:MAG: flagellar basal body rod protein FlgC [Armatimonadota bacterium]
MGNFSSMDISASGLFAQRARLDAIANNIANADTTRTAEGGPYRKQEVVLQARPAKSGSSAAGVDIAEVTESSEPPRMVYDPSHPDAGKDGFVAYPDVNIVEEMVDMVTATRAYEANVAAMGAARQVAAKALEIGRG